MGITSLLSPAQESIFWECTADAVEMPRWAYALLAVEIMRRFDDAGIERPCLAATQQTTA
jgi:hypothetical protein